jgi:glycosyltransferase involved in cell wall biosynthesis
MKILQVSKFLVRRGGVETYLIDLGQLLKSVGHEVEYFGMDDAERVVGNRYGIYAPPIEFGGNQGLSRIADVRRTIDSKAAADAMARILLEFQPDVVHLNNIHYHLTPSVIEAAYAYKASAGRPIGIVMTMHDYHSIVPCDGCMNNRTYEICDKCLDGRYWRCAIRGCTRGGRAKSAVASMEAAYWARKHVWAKLDCVICPSMYMKQEFDRVSDFTGRTVHLPNFSNLERRTYEKERYVLYFGAYNRDKGVATLLEVAKRHPEIEFRFSGRGPLAPSMRSIPNVCDLGFNTGEKLHAIVGRAALVVVPSECLENSPFTVIEAFCAGTPVLGARIGGIPELVEDGVTGELFEFRNSADLERRLVSLWNDQEKCAHYAANCVRFEPMSGRHYLSELMSIYEKAAARPAEEAI